MKTVLLLLFLSVLIFSQSPVEPVKVSVIALGEDEIDARLVESVKSELRELRYIAIVERGGDWIMAVMAAPINGVSCEGYAAVLIAGSGQNSKQDRVSMHTAPDMEALARHLVEKMEKDFFTKRRRAPKD